MTFCKPKTVREYEVLAQYVKDYRIGKCCECGSDFEFSVTKKGPHKKTCSDQCVRERELRQGRIRMKKWREMRA